MITTRCPNGQTSPPAALAKLPDYGPSDGELACTLAAVSRTLEFAAGENDKLHRIGRMQVKATQQALRQLIDRLSRRSAHSQN